MKIKDESLIRIHLFARTLSEAALVCGYTSPNDNTYDDRMKRVEEEVDTLLKALGVKP